MDKNYKNIEKHFNKQTGAKESWQLEQKVDFLFTVFAFVMRVLIHNKLISRKQLVDFCFIDEKDVDGYIKDTEEFFKEDEEDE